MCRLQNIALESVTEKCDRRTDKVIPMCRYASQATQKITGFVIFHNIPNVYHNTFCVQVSYLHQFGLYCHLEHVCSATEVQQVLGLGVAVRVVRELDWASHRPDLKLLLLQWKSSSMKNLEDDSLSILKMLLIFILSSTNHRSVKQNFNMSNPDFTLLLEVICMTMLV